MLFTMIMPVVMIIILWGGRKGFLNQQAGFLFPIGAAYCLLVMNNILYNSFGGDGGGIQFFLVSPISFRKIMAAKNLAQLMVLAAELFVLWLGVSFITGTDICVVLACCSVKFQRGEPALDLFAQAHRLFDFRPIACLRIGDLCESRRPINRHGAGSVGGLYRLPLCEFVDLNTGTARSGSAVCDCLFGVACPDRSHRHEPKRNFDYGALPGAGSIAKNGWI